jgi:4-hydroxy-tetrahydrodipicolinate synthase
VSDRVRQREGTGARTLSPGVHAVMVTPFLPDESIDEASLATLIDAIADAGCAGVLVLGVMGEADRLSDGERELVISRTIALAADRLQVTVGITHGATVVAAERAQAAVRDGATAVMVAPPVGSVAGPELKEHFRRIGQDLPIPIVVQDHPASSGVKLPVDFLVDLAEVVPTGSIVKLEDPPAPLKIARLLERTNAFQVLGGLGGVSLFDELNAGSNGVMTGFALPEVLVAIVNSHHQGDREDARRTFNPALPLMLFESQPGAGAALRKETLVRRGLISNATVRQPAVRPDPYTLGLLDDLLVDWDERSR